MPVTMTGNTSIDYDISGEGPPLLLIGGLGFGRWGWFKQVPAFTRHFRTITFDVRGERRLENGVGDLVQEVVSLLDHLGVKKAHVLGTSLGGFVAQELALLRPDLVDRRSGAEHRVVRQSTGSDLRVATVSWTSCPKSVGEHLLKSLAGRL